MTSTKPDFTNSYNGFLTGTWTKESNEINDRPIYKLGDLYLAVKTVATGYIPSWVAAYTPGSGSGFMFGRSGAPKCPQAVTSWAYYSQTTGAIEEDDSLTVTCGASECLYLFIFISVNEDYTFFVECSGAIPATPAGASVTYDGGDTAGTVVTYTCSGGNKVYVVVSTVQSRNNFAIRYSQFDNFH